MYIVSPDLTSGLVAHDTLVILMHSQGSNFLTLPSSKLPIFNLQFFTVVFYCFGHWSPVSVLGLRFTPLYSTLCLSVCLHGNVYTQAIQGRRVGGGGEGGGEERRPWPDMSSLH
jgi:hypothetical protein